MKNILASQRIIGVGKRGNLDSLEENYTVYFDKKGSVLLPFSNFYKKPEMRLKEIDFDAVFLSGGNNVSPWLAGVRGKVDDCYRERDRTEQAILDYAVRKKIPVLGFCKGMQIINVYFNGKIKAGSKDDVKEHVRHNHKVEVMDNDFYRNGKTKVNSFHSQVIPEKFVGKNLMPFIFSEEGYVEGFYHEKYPVLGIIWHPERMKREESLSFEIVDDFLKQKGPWGR